jgi:ATP adenylyltransferase/5',5'''-P-1,P-4-tetraphosphate phosphorylase II
MQDHRKLFEEQIASWPLAAENYRALKGVLSKTFFMDGVRIQVQCNPARLTSSSADISREVIQERPCFLCAKNRPPEQTSLPFSEDRKSTTYQNNFLILVNPFPVFPKHFTIAGEHLPQTIHHHFSPFLDLARQMDDCVVFYNGPRCGASAPDHLHFQAGSKGLMPVEADFPEWRKNHLSPISVQEKVQVSALKDFLRGGWLLESTDKTALTSAFECLLEMLETARQIPEEEPMLNILGWFTDKKWFCVVFPRKAHRPTCYFREDESRLLISPASVEMGGLVVAARPEDFERIQAEDLKEIYSDVSLSDMEVEKFSMLFSKKRASDR